MDVTAHGEGCEGKKGHAQTAQGSLWALRGGGNPLDLEPGRVSVGGMEDGRTTAFSPCLGRNSLSLDLIWRLFEYVAILFL